MFRHGSASAERWLLGFSIGAALRRAVEGAPGQRTRFPSSTLLPFFLWGLLSVNKELLGNLEEVESTWPGSCQRNSCSDMGTLSLACFRRVRFSCLPGSGSGYAYRSQLLAS